MIPRINLLALGTFLFSAIGAIFVCFNVFLINIEMAWSKIVLSVLGDFFKATDFWQIFFGSFFGAVGGALIIYGLKKSERKRQDITYLNRAIGIVGCITNVLVGIKRDYSLPQAIELRNIYDEYNLAKIRIKQTNVPNTINVIADDILKKLPSSHIPTQELIEALTQFSKSGAKTFMLAFHLNNIVCRLQNTIDQKNSRIEQMERDPRPTDVKIPIYLGLTKNDGSTDELMTSFVTSIEYELDEALHTAQHIYRLLVDIGHGKVKAGNKVAELAIVSEMEEYLPKPEAQ